MLYHYKQVALCAFLFFSYCMATAQPVNRYDVVISEIMADPSPSVQLPASEWVELHNTSGSSVNLQGCRLADATGTSGPLPAFVLQPDSFVVICASSALPALLPLGPAIAVTAFPSLDNGGDLLQLRSPQGSTLHAVGYADTWYQNDLKREGGWTLEMIDTRNPCTGHGNWMASTDAKGGTPGRRNSVAATRTDVSAPRLLRAFATDSLSLTLVFNEPLDSARAAVPGSYAIDGLAAPVAAVCLPPLFNRVVLQPGSPLLRNKVYTVNAKASITDCRGNALGSGSTARVGLATMADSLAVVLNELLFNPRPGGTDYVELYNRSPQVIDLQQLFLANRSATGTLTNIRPLSNGPHLLFPQGFAVATDDPELVRTQYIAQDLDAFVTVAPLPAMSNDKGHLVLLNAQGRVVDQLAYTEKWHYPLVGNAEGIALERIDYNAPTQQPDNWHSAASSVGHGTPTYPNSQRRANAPLPGSLSVTPAICSPNNDGQDDFVTVAYQFPEPGYVANCTLFDAGGRPVRLLQRNMLCGTQGSFKWDGLGQKNQRLPKGIYIVYTEVFNLQGKTGRFKQVVTLVD